MNVKPNSQREKARRQRPLTCCICNKITTFPIVTMKCCGSIACKKCLMNYIQYSSNCPKCGLQLPNVKGQEKSICSKHNKSFEYRCNTCSVLLCPDCLFEQLTSQDTSHSGHQISKISELYKNTKETINEKITKLQKKKEKLKMKIQKLKKLRYEASSAKDEIFIESNSSFRILQNHLEEAYIQKQKSYNDISDKLENQMKNIQLTIEEAELLLTNNDQKSAIVGEEFLQKVQRTLDAFEPTVVDPPSTDWTNELVPPFKKLEFKISNFKQYYTMFKKCKGEEVRYLYSPTVSLYGGVWRAKIYPNGNSNGLHTHLSVYIELIKGISSSSFVYRVEIENTKPKNEKVVKQYVSTFEEMDSWGWNKVIPLETLFNGYVDENGAVSFEISLRPESYLVCAKRSAEELEKVKAKCKKLKQELREKGIDPNDEHV